MAATLGASRYALRGAALAVGRGAVEGDGMKRREFKEGRRVLHGGAIAPPSWREAEGAMAAVRTRRLCRDSRCITRMRKALVRLAEMGPAVRLGREVYLVKRMGVRRLMSLIRL